MSYKIRLAERLPDGQLHLQGVIEVPGLPAVGDAFFNDLFKNGRHLRVHAQIAEMILQPKDQPSIHAIAVVRTLKVEGLSPN